MKKLLSILGSITMIGSVGATTVAVSSNVNSNKLDTKVLEDTKSKVLDENISSLEKIDQALVLRSLVQKANNVVINYKLFLDKGLTTEFIELIKNFELTNTNISDAGQLLFTKTTEHNVSVYRNVDWQVSVEAPQAWYEWMSGVWRLELNHGLVESIVSGSISWSEMVRLIGEAGTHATATVIASAILASSGWLIGNADQGNGILIRFLAWITPTKITNSNHNWN